ncbi:MAG: hypothetical protein PHY14_00470 [Candidatus Gracilibacteria bacterium]|nr:hypothetical protein [Candidatus Gracilibacteria bacterium]
MKFFGLSEGLGYYARTPGESASPPKTQSHDWVFYMYGFVMSLPCTSTQSANSDDSNIDRSVLT